MNAKLELYYYPECPFCRMVLWAIDDLRIADKIELKNIRRDESARQTLVTIGGKQQVPCLFIDGSPLYESSDIIAWLKQNAPDS